MKLILKIFFIIAIIILLFVNQIAADDNHLTSYSEINLRSFHAYSESIKKDITIILPLLNKDINEIEVTLDFNSKEFDNILNISGSALTIQTKNNSYNLDKNKSLIAVTESKFDFDDYTAAVFNLSYEVTPHDLPGNYSGFVNLIQKTNIGEKDRAVIKLSLQVEPWVKIEKQPNIHLISKTRDENLSLTSYIPGSLRVSGNVPWELYVSSNKNSINKVSNIKLNLIEWDNKKFIPEVTDVLLNSSEISLGIGLAATENEYHEIIFTMLIEDFTLIEAGPVEFPVHFRVEPILKEVM